MDEQYRILQAEVACLFNGEAYLYIRKIWAFSGGGLAATDIEEDEEIIVQSLFLSAWCLKKIPESVKLAFRTHIRPIYQF